MEPLTATEKEIVILVARGHKNREIGDKLGLAEQTVRNRLCEIYAKTGVKNRAGLTMFALRAELIDVTREK